MTREPVGADGPGAPAPSMSPIGEPRLRTVDLAVGYDGTPVVRGVDLAVPSGTFTAIIGPNACGKSTLLRSLVRLLEPSAGAVLLDGRPIAERPTREVAKVVGLLPQAPLIPEGMTVVDLVARARFPHRHWYDRWSQRDERAVQGALEATGVADLASRAVDELSGGQRQRVWLALCLAQETPVLLLDEPTTFLDLAHQIEVLDLVRRLVRDHGRTVVAVLHDLQHAARYADHLVAMRDGRIVAEGPPGEVLTEALVLEVYDVGCRIIEDPVTGGPLVVPLFDP
jgi:iron complex transport system ATP-binding protein